MRGARVIIACRDPEKAEKAIREVKFKSHSLNVGHMELDLANLRSVREFCKNFLQRENGIGVGPLLEDGLRQRVQLGGKHTENEPHAFNRLCLTYFPQGVRIETGNIFHSKSTSNLDRQTTTTSICWEIRRSNCS